MKNKIILLIVLLGIAPVYAKDFAIENGTMTLLNVTSTGNIFLVPSGGFVGIGTTVMSQLLTVAGNANITGTLYASNFFGNAENLTGISSTNISILYGTNASNTSQVLPARVSTEGNLMFSIQEGTGTGWTRVSGNIYPTTLTDSVGIGTAAPNQLLHVSGGNLNISGGNAFITGALVVNGTDVTRGTSSDNTTLTAMLGQKLNLTGGTLSGALTGTTGTFANGLNVTAGGLIVAAGNVGIGTTFPQGSLDVNLSKVGGDVNLTIRNSYAAENATSENVSLIFGHAIYPAAKIVAFKNGDFYSNSPNISGGLAFYTNNNGQSEKVRIAPNGNVGIGTTDIEAWASSYQVLQFPVSAIMAHKTAGAIMLTDNAYYDGAYKRRIAAETAQYAINTGTHEFRVAGTGTIDSAITWTTAMYITNAGNVGIGTTGPTGRLHVVGIDGLNNTDYLATFNNQDVTSNQGSGVLIKSGNDAGDSTLRIQKRDGTEIAMFRGDGNVGIGTAGPGAKLHISGAATTLTGGSRDSVRIDDTTAAAINVGPGLRFVGQFSGGNIDFGSVSMLRESATTTNTATAMTFYTVTNPSTSSAERMRIDSSGNVGIGTTAPGAKLELAGDGATSAAAKIILRDTVSGLGVFFLESERVSSGNRLDIGEGSDTFLTIRGDNDDGGTSSRGNVGIGTTVPDGKLDVNGTSYFRDNMALYATKKLYLDSGSDSYIVESAANQLDVIAGGAGGVRLTSGATSWAAISDERLKTDLTPITGAIEKLSGLRTVIGRYLTDEQGTRRIMLIAQDVQSVFPEAVGTDGNGYLNLRYTELIPPVIGAIQELNDRTRGLGITGQGDLTISGNVGIGTTSPGYTLTVAGTSWTTNNAWAGSDIRWKQNIVPLQSSLDKVMRLKPVNFDWRTSEFPDLHFTNDTQIGFIAQDVEKIIPEVVTTDNNGYKGISYERITPVLAGAIQELNSKIDELRKENQRLSGEIEVLKQKKGGK